ncbi:MAG: carbohydrate-binding protein [Oscillospiraceae bacterium]|nr:carbohydrate-binding protein [Oscillospiraceae bacterium]
MRALDIITELNGARVENTASLAALYDAVPIGGEITLKVWRENRYIKIVYTKSVNDNRVAMNNIYIEAEQYDDKINRDTPKTNGCPDTTGSGWNLGNIQGGDWVVYKGLYFLGTPQSITVRASKDAGIANVSFWIGGRNAAEGGTLIATCQIPGLTNPQHPAYSPGAGGQAGWDTYFTFTSSAITVDMTGEQDLYMVFDTSVNINWFQFNPGGEPPEVPWDGPLYQKGDVNRNGNIDIGDARLVLQHLVGKIVLDAEQSELAKVNNGLTLTIADARLILQKLVDKIDKFPVDK